MLHLNSLTPAVEQLRLEGLHIDAQHRPQAKTVALLNLMPEKCATELDIFRMLASSQHEINLTLLKFPGQTYKTTPPAYMEAHYIDWDATWADRTLDGLIITGAPVEQMAFEEVRYWPQLCQLMAWSRTHTRSTLNICWAAQAALHFHHGVAKHPLPHKMFGIFPQDECLDHPLTQGLAAGFPMPHSRHTEVRRSDIPASLQIVSHSAEAGLGIVADEHANQVFVFGHLEYEAATLNREYQRDLAKRLPIALPRHYYHNDSPALGIHFSWREVALRFYDNWLTILGSPLNSPLSTLKAIHP
ncbi:MAG: homoserine O-succinyltransferase [Bacteroidaceae bacterium]|nr:homoserine O-succinyltransferase [Bacteroidaceae bacterium]